MPLPARVKFTSDPPGVRYGDEPRKKPTPPQPPPGVTREEFLEAIETELAKRDPARWIPRNFYLYDTGLLMPLYDCQVRPLKEAYLKDEDGNFVYNTVLWSWPKKSAKSSVIAANVEYLCMTRPRTQVRLVANDLRQADSRVGMYLRESIKIKQRKMTNGELPGDPEVMGIKINSSGYTIAFPNGSLIEMVPIDPSGEAGGNDDLIVFSELWGWKSDAHQKMWSEMTLSSTKYGKSQRWIDTYAGFSGESPILEQLYQAGVTDGERIWEDLEVYKNLRAKLLTVWVTKPMLPWQTNKMGQAYYAEQEATLAPNEFRRMHLNQWVSSSESFVPEEWWDACKSETIPPLYKNQEIVLSADAGYASDCFAIVGISVEHEEKDIQTIRFAVRWEPPKNGTITFDDPFAPYDVSYPAGFIRTLCRDYNIVKLVYDPSQLHDLMTRLIREHIVDCQPFDQGQRRLIADKHLFDEIRERSIRHNGNVVLREHVLNANRTSDPKGEKNALRIVKRSPHLKIDLTVACSMGSHEGKRLNL